MKKRNTKRSLFLSIMALVLCCALLAGTTLAWFTDSASSGINKIVAGNLDVELYHTNENGDEEKVDSNTDNLFTDVNGDPILWEPGAYAYEKFTVKNEGTLALKYRMGINVASYDVYDGHDLREVLRVAVVDPDTDLSVRPTNLNGKTLTEWSYAGDAKDATLYAKNDANNPDASEKQYIVIVYWDPNDNAVDNAFNMNNGGPKPMTITLGVELFATQVENENDSFGHDYDQGLDATLPDATTVSNAIGGGTTNENGGGTLTAAAVPATQSNVKDTKVDVPDGTLTPNKDVKLSVNTTNTLFQVSAEGAPQVASIDLTLTVDGTPVTRFDNGDVTVTTYISTGLTNVQVTYTDPDTSIIEAITVDSYDPVSGKLVFKTSHFSTFDVKANAIAYNLTQDKGYAPITTESGTITEEQAYQMIVKESAESDDTITLAPDADMGKVSDAIDAVVGDENSEIEKDDISLVIPDNGSSEPDTSAFEATVGGKYYATLAGAIKAANSGDTITLLKDVTDDYVEGAGIVYDLTGKTLDLNGNTYSHNNFAHVFEGTGGTIKNGTMVCLNGGSYALFVGDDGKTESFTVDGVTMTGGINIYNATNVVLKNLNVTGTNYYAVWLDEGAEATIESGTYTAGKVAAVDACATDEGVQSVLTIVGGTIDANGKPLKGESGGELVISGGKFTVNPTDYLASGYKATAEGGYHVVSQCTDHKYDNGVCTECGKLEETWLAIENAMTEAPEGYSFEGTTVTISTNYGLAWFAKQVNAGNNFSGYTVTLADDIDLLDYPWTPINGFTGTFDGGEHTISNIYVNGSPTGEGYGLFGKSNAKAYKNVKIHNVHVVGNAAIGALVGDMFTGTVDNVHVSGDIMIGINTQNGHIANYNSSYAGGIVGHGYAKITNCSVKGNDGSIIGHGRQVGGIYGFSGEGNFTPVKNCTVENVTLIGTHSIGGILGWAHYGNNVENCSVKDVAVKITTSYNSIGFITGTTNAEDCGNNQMMEFYGNTVENSSLYVQDVLVSQEATMENMYAPYGYGPYYTTDGNGNYVFFANKAEAEKYVLSHQNMTIKYTSFNGQIADAEDGATINIDQDMTLAGIELKQSKTITIDLHGHTVTATGTDVFYVETGKLIVIDSVGGGKINHTGTDDLVWLASGGTLQLDAGSYSFATKFGIVYGAGTLTINGGSYEFAAAYEEDMQGYVSSGKTVTINGVSFTKE